MASLSRRLTHEVATRIESLKTETSALWLGPPIELLPSIGSITATTDTRPFLAPGVPLELVRAALRRAWVVDPRIRDYRGLQENDWDFEGGNGPPGFGPLKSGDDARELRLRHPGLASESRERGLN